MEAEGALILTSSELDREDTTWTEVQLVVERAHAGALEILVQVWRKKLLPGPWSWLLKSGKRGDRSGSFGS